MGFGVSFHLSVIICKHIYFILFIILNVILYHFVEVCLLKLFFSLSKIDVNLSPPTGVNILIFSR